MGFGSTVKPAGSSAAASSSGGNFSATGTFVPITGTSEDTPANVKGGTRIFRLLPQLDKAGQIVKVDGLEVTAQEYAYLSVWLDVNIANKEGVVTRGRREVRMDVARKWDNPYWKRIADKTEKGSQQRRDQSAKFVMNVLDRTPVLMRPDGSYLYPNEHAEFTILPNGKWVPAEAGTGQRLDQIRILQGSHGESGGRSLIAGILLALKNFDNEDGSAVIPHKVNIKLAVSGAGKKVERYIGVIASQVPVEESLLFAPRYDLAAFAKPWPDEAVNALIDGAEYNEVVKTFGLVTFPKLVNADGSPLQAEADSGTDEALFP